jgi:tRNA(Ile2) C34 agmatinyltransferase TiaS
MSESLERAELEAGRIRANKCPKCGADVKDKGSYIRCTSCAWSLTNGEWHDEGYVIDRDASA